MLIQTNKQGLTNVMEQSNVFKLPQFNLNLILLWHAVENLIKLNFWFY
jgi:hypothetical protein